MTNAMTTDSSAATSLPESPTVDEEQSVSSNPEVDARETRSGELPPNKSNLRSSSSRIANLRAAFEGKVGTEIAPPKRRLRSAERHRDNSFDYHEADKEVIRMKSELEKEKELRIAFEEKCTALEDEMEEIQQRLEQQTIALKAEWERKSVELQEDRENALLRVQHKELEAKANREDAESYQLQIIDLKKSISQSTRIEGQVTDSTLSQELQLLYHEIQNWVVNNFRRTKCEMEPNELCQRLEKAVQPEDMQGLRPLYHNFERSAKLAIFQSTVVHYMMKIFGDTLIFGLPSNLDWQQHLSKITNSFVSVLDSVTYNKWRSMTLDSIRHSPIIIDSVDASARSIVAAICSTLAVLTESEQSELPRASLETLIKRAVSLSHTFRIQRPQYEFVLPICGSTFDDMSMEDVAEETDPVPDKSEQRIVLCATFPSVYKLGDEVGDHMHLRNVVVKAKVLCKEAS
nr:hypothetical protein CFP56_00301 [Quercus suber]